jgi:hypothetical protein
MFSPREQPLEWDEQRLLALRFSLNTPVVSTPELPAGPARAAIVVHGEGGRPRFTVAIRPLKGGVSVLYDLEGEGLDLAEPSTWSVALDAALSFGESMGFLFDDEALYDRDATARAAAMAQLREIVPPAEGSAAAEPVSAEILLEDVEQLQETSLRPVDRAAPGRMPAVALSKFRESGLGPAAEAALHTEGKTAEAPPPPPPAPRRGTLLGRVFPIRRRAPEAPPPPASPLLRLLSWF